MILLVNLMEKKFFENGKKSIIDLRVDKAQKTWIKFVKGGASWINLSMDAKPKENCGVIGIF